MVFWQVVKRHFLVDCHGTKQIFFRFRGEGEKSSERENECGTCPCITSSFSNCFHYIGDLRDGLV